MTANKAENTFYLPRNYIKFLTPGFDSISHQFKWLFMLTGVGKQLQDCFRNGGGIAYTSYPEFHAWMNEFSVKRHEALLLQQHIPSIPGKLFYIREGGGSQKSNCMLQNRSLT